MKSAEDLIPILNDNSQSWTATIKAIQLDARIAGLKEAESVVKLCNGLFTLESGCERILGVAQSAILNRIRELESSPEKEGG